MANKKQKLLKGMLATAMITGAANSAMAGNDWTYTTAANASWNVPAATGLSITVAGAAAFGPCDATVAGAATVNGAASALAPSYLASLASGTSVSYGGTNTTTTTASDTISLSLGHAFNFINDGTAITVQDIDFTAGATASVNEDLNAKGDITGGMGQLKFGAAKTITVDGTGVATDIDFNSTDSKLVFSSSAAANVGVTGDITLGADKVGVINAKDIPAGKALTIEGDVGTSAHGLKSIDVGSGNLVLNAGTATVRSVNAAELTLRGVGSTHTIGAGATGTGYGTRNGILNIGTNALTIGSGSNFENLSEVYFDGNNVTTVADGVNLVAASVSNKNQGEGKLLFTGDATFDAKMTDRKIADISMGTTAASKVLKIKQDVVFGNAANTINFNGGGAASDAVIEIYGNVKGGGGIDVVGGGTAGHFSFKNAKGTSVTVDGNLSPTAEAQSVKIGDGNVTFTAVTNAGGASALTFTSTENKDATLTLKGNAPNLGLITTAKDGFGIIEFDNDVDTTGFGTTANSFGTSAAKLQAFRFLADKTLTVGPSVTIYGDIRTSVDGKGTATFNGVHDKVYGIGEKDKAYKAVSFDDDTTLLGNVYSKGTSFAPGVSGKTLTLSAGLYSPLFLGTPIGADTVTLKVSDKGIIGDAVKASASNATIAFDESATVLGQLGDSTNAIHVVGFNGTSAGTVKVGKDIYGTTMNQTKGTTVQLTDSAKFVGNYNVTGSTIDLGANTLTLSGGVVTLDGKVQLNTNVTLADGQTPTVGKLVLDSTASGIATKAASGVINVNMNETQDYLPRSGDSIVVIDANTAGGTRNTTNMVQKFTTLTGAANLGDFVKAGIANNGKIVEIKLERDISALITDLASADPEVKAFAEGLKAEQHKVTGDAALLLARLNYMTPAERQASLTRLVERVQSGTVVAEAVQSALTDSVNAQMSTDASSMGTIAPTSGVGSGDEVSAPSMGAWVKAIGGIATQKLRKGDAGYKSQMQGGVIGFDTAVNDSTVVGIAAATANTTLKHKDAKAGDKTKATTYMFAVYGMREFGGNWIAQGSAMFGNSSIKNTEKRILARGGVTANATGKFDTMTYAMELLGGYRFNVSEGANVTPMFGMKYAKFNQGGYTETGAGYQNTTVSKKNTDKIAGVIGARADYTTQMGDVAVSPEVHAFMNYDFKAKAPKVDVRLDGYNGSITSKGNKPARISWNLGTSVMAKSGVMEYGLGYDAHLSNKYVGHQGAIKVRVNF